MSIPKSDFRIRIQDTFNATQLKSLVDYIEDHAYTEDKDLREYDTKDIEVKNLFSLVLMGYIKAPYPETDLSEIDGLEAAAFGPKEELPRIGADPGYILAVRAIALWRVSECADPGSSHPRAADGGPG